MKAFKSPNRKLVAASGVVAVLVASIVTRTGVALPSQESVSDQDVTSLDGEFSDFVRGAIHENSTATEISEWLSSGYTPSDIIANAEARRERKTDAFAALCRVLVRIDDEGLALFQNELDEPKVRAELPCAGDLSARLQAYWDSRRIALEAERMRTHMGLGLRDADETLPLPSEEYHVDASKGEVYPIPHMPYAGLKENQIAITIDDGPHPTITRKILNTLQAYGVRANFFSVGRPAKVWPQLDKAETDEGHVTGSHSMTHPMLAQMDIKSAQAEILGGRKAVADAAGVDVPFFRFPYGSHNSVLDAFVKSQQMTSFLWNMDSEDWKRPDPTDLFHNEVAQLNAAKGGIILMHDIHEQTAIALPHLLDELRHRNFTTIVFVPH